MGPTIVQSPGSHLIAAEGSNVSISCRAVGTPTPLISWQHHYKDVPADPRIKFTSVNGLGTVLISQLQPSDGGPWTCAAVNSQSSRLAPYDTDLIVKCTPKSRRSPSGQDFIVRHSFHD